MKLLVLIFSLYIVSSFEFGTWFNFNNFDSYDENMARSYIYYSSVAYCENKTKILTWNCAPCSKNKNFTPYKTFYDPSTHTFGYMGYTDKDIVISFKGTDPKDIKNWITNLNFAKQTPYKKVPNAAVHEGFYSAYNSVSSQVTAGTKDLISIRRNANIYITGHSLGGALATLCAVDIKTSVGAANSVYLYTFGTPRVGNAAFAQYFTSLTAENWRVIHYADLVPHLPLQSMNFHHEPREVWYNETFTSYKVCDTTGEDSTCSGSLGKAAISIPDHVKYFNFEIAGLCNSNYEKECSPICDEYENTDCIKCLN